MGDLAILRTLNLVPGKSEDIPAFERDEGPGWFSAFHLTVLCNTNWTEKRSNAESKLYFRLMGSRGHRMDENS